MTTKKEKMKKTIYIFSIILLSIVYNANAQQTPAAEQDKPLMLRNGTVHTVSGDIIKDGTICITAGKINYVGPASAAPNTAGYDIIDCDNLHIYPGLIMPVSNIGLKEIGAVRATRDYDDVGQYNPNLRSIVAFNTDSEVTPTVRSNGVMIEQVIPYGGVISGTSSIVELDAWNWEDAVYKMDDAIFLNWPSAFYVKGFWSDNPGEVVARDSFDEEVQSLEAFFAEAKSYVNMSNPSQKNLKFEAMRGLFDGSKKLFIDAWDARQIISAVEFNKAYKFDIVITGAAESWMVTELLSENDIPVILAPTHALPEYQDDDIDQPFKTPHMLEQAGVRFCLSPQDGAGSERNLPFLAGTAAAYGLSKAEAIKSITLNTAEILGISETLGSIEEGKDGTLIISKGDVLDMRSSHILHGIIRGKQIDLNTHQKDLYRKFMGKYELELKQH